MALSSKASVIRCSSYNDFAHKRISETTTSNLIDMKSLSTQSWRIAQDDKMRSFPLRNFDSDDFQIKHAQKVMVHKRTLSKLREDPFQSLAMVDAIQRLGIDHHFQEEIEAILARQYLISNANNSHKHLHLDALRFRLLRQEGYHVPSGIFDTYIDKEGSFRQKLDCDIKGLMSLFEASQLSIDGEHALDHAGESSFQILSSMISDGDSQQARLVRYTLDHPHHKSLAKFMAKNFYNGLHWENGWLTVLQGLAKSEFMIIQYKHQGEILQISKWWKDLGLSKQLKFARDQPLKWYTWSIGCLADPNLSEQRIELTKVISFIYIIDDIFDVYGSLDELELFTEVVNRWEIMSHEKLPDYMKLCFNALDNITNEISFKVYKQHGWNPIGSLRNAWAKLCSAFLVEAKWFASGKLPSAEHYLENGVISSGVHVVLVHIFFLLGEGITDETVQLVDSTPSLISSIATILRLWDDLGTAKDEEQDGYDGSYVECYMKEHEGTSVERARNHVVQMISKAWKSLNQECLSPNPFSTAFTKASLNIARMVPLMYGYDQNRRLPSLEEHLNALLYDEV